MVAYPMSGTHSGCLAYRNYLGSFSKYRKQPAFSISRTGETRSRPLPIPKTAAQHLSPGYYPTDRDLPQGNRAEEIQVGYLTRSASRRHTNLATTSDRWNDILDNKPGPGTYEYTPCKICGETEYPSWSIPNSHSIGGRPIPRAKTAADDLGPGMYKMPNRFSEISARKQALLERAARNPKNVGEHWAGVQYSHVFRRINPKLTKSLSSPLIPRSHASAIH